MACFMMASGTGCLQRFAAKSVPDVARRRHSTRDHPASVPVGQHTVLLERMGLFLYAHAGMFSLLQAKIVPSRHKRIMTTAILRAAATAAFLKPLRAARRTAQAFSVENRRTLVISSLAAFLAADVVGYSRLREADKAGTVATIKAHRWELWKPKIQEHGGRVVGTAGDSIRVEFASAVAAVELSIVV